MGGGVVGLSYKNYLHKKAKNYLLYFMEMAQRRDVY
jgi:hypothetical protein